MPSGGIPRTLAVLRKEVAELRKDAAAESEAIADILHKLDQVLKILRVVAVSQAKSVGEK